MNINQNMLGEYYKSKHSCIHCGSKNIILSMREVLDRLTQVYLCTECDNFYMDINQLQKMHNNNYKQKESTR